MNNGMIFTWGVELLVFWLLFLGLYVSSSFDRALSLTGLVSSGLVLAAHVALAAWDPRDLLGGDAADPDAGVPLYRADISNAFLSLHLGLLVDALLAPASVAWATTVNAALTYTVLVALAVPALGLAFASAQGRTYLFLQRHALMGIWWPALARLVACNAPAWGWVLPVIVLLLFVLHLGRRDMLASAAGTGVVLVAGLVLLFAQGADVVPWTAKFVLVFVTLVLTGGAQIAWTVLTVRDWQRKRKEDDKAGGKDGEGAGGAEHNDGADDDNTAAAPPQDQVDAAAAVSALNTGGGMGYEAGPDDFTLMFHNIMMPTYSTEAAARHRRPPRGSGVGYISLDEKIR